MGGRGGTIAGKSSRGASAPAQATQQTQQQQRQQQQRPANYRKLSGAAARNLINGMWNYDISTRRAINQYIRQDQDRNGYTMSQNMNHKMENGQDLTANEQYTADYMVNAAKPVGQDVILTRGAHQDVLQNLGVRNYQNMTESQLRQALVGQTYTENKFVSASLDESRNPFLHGAPAGGREVVTRISTPASTRVTVGDRKESELVIAPGASYRITGVHYTGATAYPRNSGRSLPVVQLDVEVVSS